MKNWGLKSISCICVLALSAGMISGCEKKPEEPQKQAPAQATCISSENSPIGTIIDQYENYELVWDDEFDGDSVNTEIWKLSDSNAFSVSDGALCITPSNTKDEAVSITTDDHFGLTRGKIVIRAKVPSDEFLSTAINVFSRQSADIYMQMLNVNGTNLNTASVSMVAPKNEQNFEESLRLAGAAYDYSEDYHIFTLDWDKNVVNFSIGQMTVLSAFGFHAGSFNSLFNLTMNIVNNNGPEATDNMLVDYVRVYKKTSAPASPYEGRTPNEEANLLGSAVFAADEDLNDETGWNFLLLDGGAGSAEIIDGALEITSTEMGSQPYSVQLVFWDVPVLAGHKYLVSFDAKASEERQMITAVTAPFASWVRYLNDTSFDVSKEYKTYYFDFTPEADDERARLEFNMGNQSSLATIDITNIYFEDITND